jgi:hypothetical protein
MGEELSMQNADCKLKNANLSDRWWAQMGWRAIFHFAFFILHFDLFKVAGGFRR